MADTSIYDGMAPSVGSIALAHQRLVRLELEGSFVNITGDVNNLALNPSPITVSREVYGTKTRTSTEIVGYNYAPSFNVEVVRDPVTKQIVAEQAWFKDLVTAAFSEGEANRRTFQFFTDALDETMPVLQGKFSVAYSEANTGYADKGVITFTLANDGVVEQIDSPLAGSGVPIIETVTPSGQAVGDQVVIRGHKFTGTTGITIKAVAVAEFIIVDAYTIVAVIPTGATGSSPVIVTNADGPSVAKAYTAAA